jgi:hypothetical protein
MQDPYLYIVMALSGIAAITIVSLTALRGWQAWLEFKKAELQQRPAPESGALPANTRIEVADLKERIRKLEAIAAGVDI